MSDLLEQINSFKNDYYSKNTKNVFFKKKQKIECAKEICQKFQLNELIEKTFFNIPNTNDLFFNYNIFKLYANEFNFDIIIQHTLNEIHHCIQKYGSYNVHIDLNSFTVSAGERYFKFVDLYINYCSIGVRERNYFISEKLVQLYLYNPPSVMDILHKMFKTRIEIIKNKVVIVSKNDSKGAIEKLFANLVDNSSSDGIKQNNIIHNQPMDEEMELEDDDEELGENV